MKGTDKQKEFAEAIIEALCLKAEAGRSHTRHAQAVRVPLGSVAGSMAAPAKR